MFTSFSGVKCSKCWTLAKRLSGERDCTFCWNRISTRDARWASSLKIFRRNIYTGLLSKKNCNIQNWNSCSKFLTFYKNNFSIQTKYDWPYAGSDWGLNFEGEFEEYTSPQLMKQPIFLSIQPKWTIKAAAHGESSPSSTWPVRPCLWVFSLRHDRVTNQNKHTILWEHYLIILLK